MSKCWRCDAETISTVYVLTRWAIELDATPRDDGDIVIRNGTAHTLRAKTPVQPGELRYLAHHDVCPGWTKAAV